MSQDPETLFKEWTGKEVRLTTIGDIKYDGVLACLGKSWVTLLYKEEPMLIASHAIVTIRQRPSGATAYDPHSGSAVAD